MPIYTRFFRSGAGILAALLLFFCLAGPAAAQNADLPEPAQPVLLAQSRPDFSFDPGPAGRAAQTGRAAAGEVVYGFDREFPPFSFLDARGRPTGFEVELVRAIALETGLTINYRPLEWSKIQPELSTGTINMTTGMIRTERRAVVFLFSKAPYYAADLRIFTQTADYVRNLGRLRGRIIGVEENSFSGEILAKYPGLGMQPFPDKTSGLKALHDSQITGYLGVGPNVDWLLGRLRYANIVPAGEALERLDMWFAVDQGSANVLKMLESGFDAVVRSGEYDYLYRKWFVQELTREERDALVAAAAEVVEMAYSPYSGKPQGAAVLCRGGVYYAAGSVENANERLKVSAVQAAVSRALAAGEMEIRACAQVDAAGQVVVPPQADLEFLAEFNRGMLVALPPVNNETAENTLAELITLPPVRKSN